MRRDTEHAYLLRLWHDHAGAPLRATLIAVGRPDVHRHFTDLDDLLSYLIAQTSPRQDREEVNQPLQSTCAQCTPDDS